MDYKIYNIELVNRLSAWQHTAFKTKTSIPIALPGREREPAAKAGEPPPDQQEFVDPLNVITWDAADFVLCHKVRCSFRCLPTRCRGPPPRLNFPKFRRNGGTAMRYRNNGQGEDNILQNQFTTYLVTAIRWQKIAYLKKRTKLGTHELPTDFDSAFAQMLETQGTSAASVEQPVLDSLMLAQALGQISDRERYIFFARALEKRSFDDLAAELGMGYKGVAAAYYRAVQKLKKEM